MLHIDFDELVLLADWGNALQKILNAAENAIEQNNSDDRLHLQGLLRKFIKNSPDKAQFLDNIAARAITDIMLSQVSAALAAIQTRNTELTQAMGLIRNATADANRDARSIRLTNAIQSLNKAKATLASLKQLEQSLDQPDQALLDKIRAVSETIEELSAIVNQ